MLNGNDAISSGIDKVINGVILPIFEKIFSFIFSSQVITILFWIIAVNLIAIILMKRDKEHAQKEKWRTRESTLLIVAFAGGALGMYYAMYKYKHKTLHKKFTILVPTFIVLHFACIAYMVISCFIK